MLHDILDANPKTKALLDAIMINDVDTVKVLLKERRLAITSAVEADVNAKTSKGNTLLHFAAGRGYSKIVKLLISAGANIDCRNNNNFSPFDYAAINKHKNTTDLLSALGAGGRVLDCKETKLFLAISEENVDKVEQLIADNVDVNAKTLFVNQTPLLQAIRTGSASIVTLLLRAGAELNPVDEIAIQPLIEAILLRNYDIAKLLIEAGADVNVTNLCFRTPLHTAAEIDFAEIIPFLVSKGAKINALDIGCYTALKIAESKGHLSVVNQIRDLEAMAQAQAVQLEDDRVAASFCTTAAPITPAWEAKGAKPELSAIEDNAERCKGKESIVSYMSNYYSPLAWIGRS